MRPGWSLSDATSFAVVVVDDSDAKDAERKYHMVGTGSGGCQAEVSQGLNRKRKMLSKSVRGPKLEAEDAERKYHRAGTGSGECRAEVSQGRNRKWRGK